MPPSLEQRSGLPDRLGKGQRQGRGELLAPIDACRLQAQERAAPRQAVPQTRHVEQIDQADFVYGASTGGR